MAQMGFFNVGCVLVVICFVGDPLDNCVGSSVGFPDFGSVVVLQIYTGRMSIG